MTAASSSSVVNFNLDIEDTVESVKAVLSSIKHALKVKSDVIRRLAVQTMRDQVRQEERVRNEGDSGIVQVRNFKEGTQDYDTASAAGHSFAALFDKAASKDILGFGEVVAVINGVEFRTHRSDHALAMPHRTSGQFLATEPIQRSQVPPSVAAKTSVQAQVEEMAEYFRAFKAQNSTHRDYQPYFQPVLCYLEAAWMSDPGPGGDVDNWFQTDRVWLGGNTWEEVHDRQRIEAVTGTKDSAGRTASLPSIITHVQADTGEPVYAQWNFRPMCQLLDGDLPTTLFRQVKDFAYAGKRGVPVDAAFWARGAHFTLDDAENPGSSSRKILEELVNQVPGLDNGKAHLNQTVYANGEEKTWDGSSVLNTGYYSHWYNIGYHEGHSAMPRGFSDRNLYVATTTQPKVAAVPVTFCVNRRSCEQQTLRVSYMLPLEIVYTTPLATWNPYNVNDFGDDRRGYRAGGKNGRTADRAFHGIYDDFFYQTPAEFFTGPSAVDPDVQDDNLRDRWVLDGQGEPHLMGASGVRTILPSVAKGVGHVRTRYPIAPVHGRGSAVWKELAAYRDTVAL